MSERNQQKKHGGYQPEASGPPPTTPPSKPASALARFELIREVGRLREQLAAAVRAQESYYLENKELKRKLRKLNG